MTYKQLKDANLTGRWIRQLETGTGWSDGDTKIGDVFQIVRDSIGDATPIFNRGPHTEPFCIDRITTGEFELLSIDYSPHKKEVKHKPLSLFN